MIRGCKWRTTAFYWPIRHYWPMRHCLSTACAYCVLSVVSFFALHRGEKIRGGKWKTNSGRCFCTSWHCLSTSPYANLKWVMHDSRVTSPATCSVISLHFPTSVNTIINTISSSSCILFHYSFLLFLIISHISIKSGACYLTVAVSFLSPSS